MMHEPSYRYKKELFIRLIEDKFPASKGLLHLLEWTEVDDGYWVYSEGSFPDEQLFDKINEHYK